MRINALHGEELTVNITGLEQGTHQLVTHMEDELANLGGLGCQRVSSTHLSSSTIIFCII